MVINKTIKRRIRLDESKYFINYLFRIKKTKIFIETDINNKSKMIKKLKMD